MPYNDNYNDGNGLRTGTYTVDHLKLSTIVGEFQTFQNMSLIYIFMKLINNT
jgi:hypothetical protein